jgi:molybdopterin-synthase adenylyltransferase
MNHSPPDLWQAIAGAASEMIDPAGRKIRVICEAEGLNLARRHGKTLGEIYAASMETGVWPLRYIRNHDSIRLHDQKKLGQSRVAVIGAGGLGGYVIQLLARAGIGHLTIIDHDCFNESNLNRQILADTTSIGKSKARIAAGMVAAINPAVDVTAIGDRMTSDNAAELLDGIHLAVDALDNMETRRVLKTACLKLEIPFVHGAISGFEGRVISIFPNDPTPENLFSHANEPTAERVMGNPPVAPAVIASLQAMEVLKIVLNRGIVFRGCMLYADLEEGSFNRFSF